MRSPWHRLAVVVAAGAVTGSLPAAHAIAAGSGTVVDELCLGSVPVPALPTDRGTLEARFVDFDEARAIGVFSDRFELGPPGDGADQVDLYREIRDLFEWQPDNFNRYFDPMELERDYDRFATFYGTEDARCVWFEWASVEVVVPVDVDQLEGVAAAVDEHRMEVHDDYLLVDSRPTEAWREEHPIPDYELVAPTGSLVTLMERFREEDVISGIVEFDQDMERAWGVGLAWVDGRKERVAVVVDPGSTAEELDDLADQVVTRIPSLPVADLPGDVVSVASTEPSSTVGDGDEDIDVEVVDGGVTLRLDGATASVDDAAMVAVMQALSSPGDSA